MQARIAASNQTNVRELVGELGTLATETSAQFTGMAGDLAGALTGVHQKVQDFIKNISEGSSATLTIQPSFDPSTKEQLMIDAVESVNAVQAEMNDNPVVIPMKSTLDEVKAQYENLKTIMEQTKIVLPVVMQKPQGLATGGMVDGPGSGTSDSIHAMLSNGEFVMKASAVQRYGEAFMSMINMGSFPVSQPVATPRVQKFANGGMVSAARPAQRDTVDINLIIGQKRIRLQGEGSQVTTLVNELSRLAEGTL